MTLAAGDASTSLTVAYTGSGTVSQVRLLEQTSTTVYDAIGRVTSTTNALGDTAAYIYDFGSNTDSTTSYTGQTVSMSSGSAAFYNLTLVPGSSRTYTIYVASNTAPASGSGYTISDTAGSLSLTFSGSANTPLGTSSSGWYELGTVTLPSTDTSTTVTVAYAGSATVTGVALVSQAAVDTDDADGNLTSHVDPLGNTTSYVYNHLNLPQQQADPANNSIELGPLYDKDGNVISTTELQNGYVTEYASDMLGDLVQTIEPNPSTGATGTGPATTDVFDIDGELISETDPSGNVTTYGYDAFGNQVTSSLPVAATGLAGGPTTKSTFDLDGEQVSLTDPDSNTTSWSYDFLGDQTGSSEKVALGEGSSNWTTATTSDSFDADGNLVEEIDADGKAITFTFNSLDQETGETWYPTAADAAAQTGSDGSESFGHDLDGDLTAASNTASSGSVASYTFQYNSAGDATATNDALAGVSKNVILSAGYNAEGDRTSLSANIGGALGSSGSVSGGINDLINTYTYDSRGDMTGITQTAQTGGSYNGVAPKNVVIGYTNNGQISSVALYASTGTSNQVYSAADTYNADLDLTDLVYAAGGSTIAGYHLDYNNNGTVADEYSRNDTTGTPGSSYTSWAKITNTYDHDSQLTGTTYGSSFANAPASGGQTYDANGNRTNAAVPSYLTQRHGLRQPHALRRHVHLRL